MLLQMAHDAGAVEPHLGVKAGIQTTGAFDFPPPPTIWLMDEESKLEIVNLFKFNLLIDFFILFFLLLELFFVLIMMQIYVGKELKLVVN